MLNAKKKKSLKKSMVLVFAIAMVLVLAQSGRAEEQEKTKESLSASVFQSSGPTQQSIDSAINAFRDELGGVNNLNNTGPLATGRREINWDGGGANETMDVPVTPFNVFLNNRGNQTSTPGIGLSQAPPSGGPQGGLEAFFNNPSYGIAFRAFSLKRVFVAVGSNITDSIFFVPGSNGLTQATVRGFGVVFSDVDLPDGIGPGKKHGNRKASTRISYYDVNDELLFSSTVPASPGDGNFSFFGMVLDDPLIARVRITTGNVELGLSDDNKIDVVVMDDFIYGEPQPLP